jgi:hypothetical protein
VCAYRFRGVAFGHRLTWRYLFSALRFAPSVAQVRDTAANLLDGYRALVAVELPDPIPPTARDPDDDHVLACLTASMARFQRPSPVMQRIPEVSALPNQQLEVATQRNDELAAIKIEQCNR